VISFAFRTFRDLSLLFAIGALIVGTLTGIHGTAAPPSPTAASSPSRLATPLIASPVVSNIGVTGDPLSQGESVWHLPAATPRPGANCGSCAYYMQEGAFLDQACFSGAPGSCTSEGGFSAIYEDVVVKSSPYSTGFELNGLTNTGDWFQSVIVENWCASGFVVANEVFNNTGSSIYGPCVQSNLIVSAGDDVQLGLNVSSSGEVCFSASDLTNPQLPYLNCVSQPDPGSTPAYNYFQFGASSSGFFTGPMTEVVDPSASSCLSYSAMPEVTYHFVQGAYMTEFTPWSDEWYPPTNTVCYAHSVPGAIESPGNFSEQFFEATGGSTYGPHWEAAENTSESSPGLWWSFSTDDSPVTLSASRLSGDVGQVVFFSASSAIGSSPLSYQFVIDGAIVSSGPDQFSWAPTGAGSFQVQVTAENSSGGAIASSRSATITVYSDPTAPPVTANNPSGVVDTGASVLFSINSTGGSGGLLVTWFGLPSACVPFLSLTSCGSMAAGDYVVYAAVNDSEGFNATSPPILFVVNPLPTVQLFESATSATIGSNVTFIAVASGGSGTLQFTWSGLLDQCVETGNGDSSVESCTLTTPGNVPIGVTATDGAGHSVSASIRFTAVTPPSTPASVPTLWLYLALAAVGAALILAASAFAKRRRINPGKLSPREPGQAQAGFAPDLIMAGSPESVHEGEPIVAPYWEAPQPTETTCRRCGTVMPPGSHYCGRCAIPLDGSGPSRPPE
jgi:hypothetical protein